MTSVNHRSEAGTNAMAPNLRFGQTSFGCRLIPVKRTGRSRPSVDGVAAGCGLLRIAGARRARDQKTIASWRIRAFGASRGSRAP